MSWWDLVIITIIALALIRGYQIGFARRLTGWVGGFFVFFIIWFNYSRLSGFVERFTDGESFVQARLFSYLDTRYPASNPLSEGRLMELIESLPVGYSASQEILRSLEASGDRLRMSMLEQVSDLLAPSIWQFILFLLFLIFGHILFALMGQLVRFVLEKVHILNLMDRYAGALFSAIFGVVLMGLLSVILLIFGGSGSLGQSLDSSYFAGAFRDTMLVFWRNGVY